MSRRVKIAAMLLVCPAAAAVGVYMLGMRAVGQVQPFYAAAARAAPAELKSAGKRMESRVSQLLAAPKPSGQWKSVFSDEEANGWLTMLLEGRFAGLLPPEVSDPRVAFDRGRCKLGYRYEGKNFTTVISVEGEAFMASPHIAAIRFRRAWAGALPLPMARVVKEVSAAARQLELPLRWTEQDGDPVILAAVGDALSTDDEVRLLEKVELRDGEIELAGRSEPRSRRLTRVVQQIGSDGG